jgi:transposase-like protein
VTGSYNAAERQALARAVQSGGEEPPSCPSCGATMSVREIEPSRQVSYVRRRVWLLCPSCKRTAAVDVSAR